MDLQAIIEYNWRRKLKARRSIKLSANPKSVRLWKHNARKKVKYAVKTGKLQRLPCQYADCTEVRAEAHHPDYDRPLDVLWLCRSHHMSLHWYERYPWESESPYEN